MHISYAWFGSWFHTIKAQHKHPHHFLYMASNNLNTTVLAKQYKSLDVICKKKAKKNQRQWYLSYVFLSLLPYVAHCHHTKGQVSQP